MQNLRMYGTAPFQVAVIHGGPGAAGEMAPVAEELSPEYGVLEPLQTAATVDGQIEELGLVLKTHASNPAILIGYSWGAWLGWLTAARYPSLVKSLILISSGPFEESYASSILQTRLDRLSIKDRQEAQSLLRSFEQIKPKDKNHAFSRFGELLSKADTFDPLPQPSSDMIFRSDIFQSVWSEAAAMRRSGRLLNLAGSISCPVTAIHGDYDPHPAEGVQKPLSLALKNFRFILLENCGHTPWIERQARERFFEVLRKTVAEYL